MLFVFWFAKRRFSFLSPALPSPPSPVPFRSKNGKACIYTRVYQRAPMMCVENVILSTWWQNKKTKHGVIARSIFCCLETSWIENIAVSGLGVCTTFLYIVRFIALPFQVCVSAYLNTLTLRPVCLVLLRAVIVASHLAGSQAFPRGASRSWHGCAAVPVRSAARRCFPSGCGRRRQRRRRRRRGRAGMRQ